MIRKIFLIWIVFGVSNAMAADVRLYADAMNFFDIEPVYNNTFESDWNSPFFGGDTAIALKEYTLGVRYQRLSIAWQKKNHTWLSFLPETAEIIHSAINQQPLDTGRDYRIRIDANVYALEGAKLAYTLFARSRFNAQLAVNYYQAKSLLYGTVEGVVTANSERDYTFQNVVLDYLYPTDELFFNEAPAPQGRGYSLDVDFNWKLAQAVEWKFSIRDLFGFIDWRKSPFTTATIDSDTKTYDENGYVKFNPTLTGHQGARNFRQPLVAIANTEIDFAFGNAFAGVAEFMYTPYKTYLRVGMGKEIGRHLVGIKVNPHDEVVHLYWKSAWGSVGIASNHPNPAFARITGINASVNYAF